MTRKKLLMFLGSVCLALILAVPLAVACAAPAPAPTPAPAPAPTPAPAPEKVYKWTEVSGTQHAAVPTVVPVLRAIEEASGGRIQINALELGVHPFSYQELLRVVRDREADMGWYLASQNSGLVPIMAAAELPLLFSSFDELVAYMEDPDYEDARGAMYDDVLAEWNQTRFCYGGFPDMILGCNNFITSFECLKGQKIRVKNPRESALVELLGGTPTSLSASEVYTALQRGIIDGMLNSMTAAQQLHQFDNCHYASFLMYQVGVNWYAVNNDAFAELPEDLQDIVVKTFAEQQEWVHQTSKADAARFTYEAIRESGVHIANIDPSFMEEMRKAMRPSWDAWIEEAGPPAAEVIKRLDEFHKEWLKTH